jgi:hypothetical protein
VRRILMTWIRNQSFLLPHSSLFGRSYGMNDMKSLRVMELPDLTGGKLNNTLRISHPLKQRPLAALLRAIMEKAFPRDLFMVIMNLTHGRTKKKKSSQIRLCLMRAVRIEDWGRKLL